MSLFDARTPETPARRRNMIAQSQSPLERAGAVLVRVGSARLAGELLVPERALGVVMVAEVSGSSSPSQAALFVGRKLATGGLGALVVDLLTPAEAAADAHTGWLRGETPLLADRICGVHRWLEIEDDARDLPVGLFAAGPSVRAALTSVARDDVVFAALVCCPQPGALAHAAGVRAIHAPTLVVTAVETEAADEAEAFVARLRCPGDVAFVRGAPHTLEDPGALDAVAAVSLRWFSRHLGAQWLSLRGG